MILIDTVVVSELRKASPSPAVLAYLREQKTEHLFLSVMTIAEIESGIERQRKGASLAQQAFAQDLQTWLTALELAYAPRILPITLPIAKISERLSAQLGYQSVDLLIAATALHHNLTVVTRNVSDFTPTGVRVFNPFGAP